MLTGAYRELFVAIAGAAAALTGLLFVAMSVSPRQRPTDHAPVVRQVRAAASILAFTNALAVTLYGLVPSNTVGYPATAVAVIGILFTAAGTRSIVASRAARRHLPGQLPLIILLLVTFGFELLGGIELIMNPRNTSALDILSNVLVAVLIIGIARAWELVGDRDTSIVTSIAVLAGHDPSVDDSSGAAAPRARRHQWNWWGRASDGQRPDGSVE